MTLELIFETPSKRCPYRIYNGRAVEVVMIGRRRHVRRAGRQLQTYTLSLNDGRHIAAFEDELFLQPKESHNV